MSNLSENVIRFAIDASKRSFLVDKNTGDSPRLWRGTAVRFDFALFFADELKGVSNLASITLSVKSKTDRLGPALMARTIGAVNLNNALTVEQWEAGTHQHGSFEFSGDDTNLDLLGTDEADFWLVIAAKTTDSPPKSLTLGATQLTVIEDGADGEESVPQSGTNLINGAATYDGDGEYVLTGLTEGKVYKWTQGDNDTSVTNGTETVTESNANFTAQGTSVTLNGTANEPVTAVIRGAVYLTAEEADARYQLAWEVAELVADIATAQAAAEAAQAAADAAQADVDELAEDMHDPLTIGDMSPNILPEFSSATEDSITVSASSEINPAWKAFDGVVDSTGGGWVGVTPTPDPECTCAPEHEASVWLQIQFPEAQIVTKYELVGPSDPERAPQRWYFEGSFDGAAWVIIEKREDQTDWEAHQVREFEAPHDDAGYIYYRWRFTHANGSAYTEVEEVRMEEECELFIIQLDGQILTLRLRIPPDSDLYCGPGGLRLKKKLFAFTEEEGGVVYRPTAPDIALEPKYATWHWTDTSVSPRITLHFNSTLSVWEPIDTGLRESGGIIITSPTALDVESVPWYGRCLWRYPGNPPIVHVWNDHTEAWMSTCDICGVEDGYHGQLPNVVFTPPTGDVPITVALSVPSVSAAVIHYTTDGSEPDGGSPVYSTPLEISEATTIKAIAYLENWLPSEVSSATYADIDETAWLLNINWRNAGTKVGRAATYDDQFSDVWNNKGYPAQHKPSGTNKANLVNADGSPAVASVEFSSWLTSGYLTFASTTHADPMMQWAIRPNAPFDNGVLGFYFVVPQGVYDLYVYGHGPANENILMGYAEDDWSARAQEGTANGTGWLSTTWAEGQQYVLFENLETVRVDRQGVNHILVPGTILFNLIYSSGNAYVSGFQLRKKKQLPKVVFTPGTGYNQPVSVQLSCPGYPTAEIRYTTNGDTPTGASTEYTTPIDVSSALTLKAIARLPGHPSGIADSAVNSATYV